MQDGKCYPGGILKVDSFINHQMDPNLMMELSKEFVSIFGHLPIEFHEKCSIRPDLNAVAIRKRYSRDEYRKQMLRSKSYDDILPLRLASFDDDEENGIYYNRQVIGNIRRKRRTNGSMAQPATILQ